MICINRNNPEELLITSKDLNAILKNKLTKEEEILLRNTLNSVIEYEQQNDIKLSTIRVKRTSELGKVLFESARKEIILHPDEIIESLIFNVLQNRSENFLDNIEQTLAQEEKSPSDPMVEQILLSRKIGFTNEKESPFCIEENKKQLIKSSKII